MPESDSDIRFAVVVRESRFDINYAPMEDSYLCEEARRYRDVTPDIELIIAITVSSRGINPFSE
jgi:hypothetical protein